MPSIKVTPGPIPSGRTPRWLVVPIAPDTARQRALGLDLPDAGRREIRALNGSQRALAFPWRADFDPVFTYGFESAERPAPLDHFETVRSPVTTPTPELAAYVQRLVESKDGVFERVEEIADYVASMFEYDHPRKRLMDGLDAVPLLTDVVRGSCIDIHGFFISCLYSAGLQGCYYAGYFFPEGKTETNGMHCWLTAADGDRLQEWDIAHQLIGRPKCHVEPGFGGVPGRRFATAHGRGLQFAVDDIRFTVSHLAYPVWVFDDGEATGLGVEARLSG